MKTAILKGLDKDQAAEVKGAFVGALPLRKQLVKLLNEKIETNREESCSKNAYVSQQWAYKQADAMGYERAMREFISLLE